jgi:GT2 family glycosyltransferase
MKVAALVLHYRAVERITATLNALLSQTRPPDRVVVVDNASGDDSPDRVRERFPQVEVIVAPENRYYAAGMNHGLRHLQADPPDAVLLLTDETVLDGPALEAMAARLEAEPRLGVVGPLLGYLSDRGRVFSAGCRIDSRTWDAPHIRLPERMSDWDGRPPHRVDTMDGACLLLRWRAVEQAGAIDERYFMYYEETDYLRRLATLGWEAECVPAARGWQEPGRISGFTAARNRLGYVQRWAPRRILLRELVRQGYYAAKFRDPGRIRGTLAFARGAWGTPPGGRP